MSYVMYPKVFEQYKDDLEQYGDVSKLPTRAFIEPMKLGEEIEVELEKGKTLGIKLSAVGQVRLFPVPFPAPHTHPRRLGRAVPLPSFSRPPLPPPPRSQPRSAGAIPSPKALRQGGRDDPARAQPRRRNTTRRLYDAGSPRRWVCAKQPLGSVASTARRPPPSPQTPTPTPFAVPHPKASVFARSPPPPARSHPPPQIPPFPPNPPLPPAAASSTPRTRHERSSSSSTACRAPSLWPTQRPS